MDENEKTWNVEMHSVEIVNENGFWHTFDEVWLLNELCAICFFRTFRMTTLLGTTKKLKNNLTSSGTSRESP